LVLEPVVCVPRRTIGKEASINPDELNGKINYFTTSGFRGSSEHERNITMIDEMAELTGKFVFGANFELAVQFGRGETKAQILDKKAKLSPIFFAMNYGSQWTGANDNALVDINKLMTLRTLTREELKGDGKSEYILGIDVARSESKANNQSSVAILKIKRNKNNKITLISLVNIINISNALTFSAQAMEVKKIKYHYNAKIGIIDSNGLGKGLLDELIKETIDVNTGETLPCWDTINNADIKPEIEGSEKCVYDLKPQSAQSEILISFIDMVDSGKLQLLEKKINAGYELDDKEYTAKMLPYINTDFLIEEVANLKLKQLPSGKYTIEKLMKRIDKDRFSALAYALWYIKTFEDNIYQDEEIDAIRYLFIN
jgi:ribonucleoside-diphosphate reductase alpha chain